MIFFFIVNINIFPKKIIKNQTSIKDKSKIIFYLTSINLLSISILIHFTSPTQTRPNIYFSHEVFQRRSNSWAIKPILIDILNQLIKPKTKWFVLCETNSVINLRKLLQSLDGEDEMKVKIYFF